MEPKTLLLFLIFPLVGANNINGPSDLCPVNFKALAKMMKSNKEEILRQMDLGFKVAQADAKKLDQEVSGHLEKQERKRIEDGKSVISKIEDCVTEKVKERDRTLEMVLQQLEKLKQNLTECGAKLKRASKKTSIKQTSSNCQKAKLLNLTRVDSSLFYFHPKHDTNWRNAKSFCVEHGMKLPTFNNTGIIKKINDANPHKKNAPFWFWVDASDIGQQPGQFVWADGTKVDAAPWQSGYPQNFGAGRESCFGVTITTGEFWDWPCTKTDVTFICELGEKDYPCL